MENLYSLYVFKVGYGRFLNFTYLIIDNRCKYAFVIDPAWDLRGINATLHAQKATLKGVLLTHSHYDHTNMVSQIFRIYDPQVFMSSTEIEKSGYRCENLNELEDMEELVFGDTKVKCIHTPGHTCGGMCFWTGNSIFTGDTVFTEGCGMCAFPGGSAHQMYNSIQRLKTMLPSDVRVYPGHTYGRPIGQTMGDLMNENIYFQIDNEETFVNFRMRKRKKGLFDFK